MLFVLARFHSAPLAGVAVMLSTFPGLIVSPLAGALLDRAPRGPLMMLDYLIGAGSLALLATLALLDSLSRPALLAIVSLGSITAPLSSTGMRSLFPDIVPRHLWDRANAVDSGGYIVATIIGPGVAGLTVAVLGSTPALFVPAGALAAGAALLFRIPLPPPRRSGSGTLVQDARRALSYVGRHRALRTLALCVSVFNLGSGMLSVGLPVLVLRRLHGGPATVGLMFAVMGVTGIFAGLAAGRVGSEGRERGFLVLGCLATVPGMALLAGARVEVLVALAMALMGAANGPLDVGLFSWRQRVTDPAWFGRAFAVSMSLNFLGYPLGAALAGPVVDRSLAAGFAVGAGLTMAAGVIALVMGREPGLARDPAPG